MNPLAHTYLPYSQRKIQFHQELLIFFWKFCEHNKKFLFFVLKSSDVLDILTPILHHLNEARADQSRVGLVHIGVFILLLLSGERNFGVRLNKPYTATVPIDIPVFTGTHADLLILVFHKVCLYMHCKKKSGNLPEFPEIFFTVWFHELIAAMDFLYRSFLLQTYRGNQVIHS